LLESRLPLYDVHRNIACRVGVIPTPIRAEILLEEHGAEAFEDELEWATSSTTNYY
jgi:hypothetical protein